MFFPLERNCRPLKTHHKDSCPFGVGTASCRSGHCGEALWGGTVQGQADSPQKAAVIHGLQDSALGWWQENVGGPVPLPPPKLHGAYLTERDPRPLSP